MRHLIPPTLLFALTTGCGNFNDTLEEMVEEAVAEIMATDCGNLSEVDLTTAANEGAKNAYEDAEAVEDWCDGEPVLGVNATSQTQACIDKAHNAGYESVWLELCFSSDTATE